MKKTNNLHMRNQRSRSAAKLISAFVFATQIVTDSHESGHFEWRKKGETNWTKTRFNACLTLVLCLLCFGLYSTSQAY